MRRVIVFDCANTLLRLSPTDVEVYAACLLSRGHAVDVEKISNAISMQKRICPLPSSHVDSDVSRTGLYREFNKAVLQELGLMKPSSDLLNQIHLAMSGNERWMPARGAAIALGRLSKHARLFVFSNWGHDLTATLANHELLHFFEGITSSAELGLEKPNPEAFLKFLSLHRLAADDCCYVGDDYELDVMPSLSIGMFPIWLMAQHLENPLNVVTALTWSELEDRALEWLQCSQVELGD